MNIFKKIFGNKKEDKPSDKPLESRGKFMPEINFPIDEKFTINFRKNGGKFLYCENTEELNENFQNILTENDWESHYACCLSDTLQRRFSGFNINFDKTCRDATFFITTCENLVADNGSILINSNQIGEKKLFELPDNFIVYATTSQLVDTIGEGLRGIKSKNKSQIPTNITTIKHFSLKEEKDFLSYGSSSKNLYLLLLEDL
ncbi:lactate utilization protein [Zhouia spongiae]|uniref:Lactate utilization protein n=1 Tax=Zhouia spongiae TaxID=2202721 RepID=A0ABY3YMI5_9FLAO|nr:LUD domain-containing protein [Zhouia spongiae]UNY98989.1 lactate utilization protein [Zhouia spongiae]